MDDRPGEPSAAEDRRSNGDANLRIGRRPILQSGVNCWRIEKASKAAVIVDAGNYFDRIVEWLKGAKRRILLIGWDFEPRLMVPHKSAPGAKTLSALMLDLARQNPRRQIRILAWQFGALKLFASPSTLVAVCRWAMTRAIQFRLDGYHPLGCSHHQKIAVFDSSLAVCGGIDLTAGRWDTRKHKPHDSERTLPNGKLAEPWHDITMVVDGDCAAALAELGGDRWLNATGDSLAKTDSGELWPEDLPNDFSQVRIGVARTRAPYEDLDEIREIEKLYLDIIAATRSFLYIENQYLTSARIAGAIAQRLAEPDPPQFVVVMPISAEGWLEQQVMDAARNEVLKRLFAVDRKKKLKVYTPVNADGEDIYVHAKIAIMDDTLLTVGSANLNNRSMGLDSECNLIIDCAIEGNEAAQAAIKNLRCSLIAEHLDIEPERYRALEAGGLSMIEAIQGLAFDGKTLKLLKISENSQVQEAIATSEIFDPAAISSENEALGRTSFHQNWAMGASWLWRRKHRRFRK